jgi:hypothetical protein
VAALFAAALICGVGLAGGASVQRFAPPLNPQQALAVDILLSVEIPVKLGWRWGGFLRKVGTDFDEQPTTNLLNMLNI